MKLMTLFLPYWSIVDVLFKDGWIVIYVSDIDLDSCRGCGLTGPWGQLTSGLCGGHLEVVYVHELAVNLPPGWYLAGEGVDAEELLAPGVQEWRHGVPVVPTSSSSATPIFYSGISSAQDTEG